MRHQTTAPSSSPAPGRVPVSPATDTPTDVRGRIVPIAICVAWGGNVVAIRFALDEFPPLWVAAARAFLAAGSLLLWTALVHRAWPEVQRRALPRFVLLATLTTMVFGLLNMALEYAPASLVVLLLYLYPIFTAAFAHMALPGERMTPRLLLSLLLGFGGTAVAVSAQGGVPSGSTLTGALLALSSAGSWASYTIVTKHLLHTVDDISLLFYPTALSALLFASASLMLESAPWRMPSFATAVALGYQGFIAATAANLAWLAVMRRSRLSVLTSYTFLTPVAGVVLSSVVLGEPLTLRHAVAATLIASGLLAVARPASEDRRTRSA